MLSKHQYKEISFLIIGCAIEVHRKLGPGLLESAYQTCLAHELRSKGLRITEQLYLPLHYEDMSLNKAYYIDILVEDAIVLELKAVEQITGLHMSQLNTYLRLGDYRLGMLLNFNVRQMKQGIKRIVNKFED